MLNKVALITDLHYGARNDNLSLINYQNRFYNDHFFTTLEKEGIKEVYILGDLVDRRKYINFNTAYRLRTDFIERLLPYQVHVIAGNHDVYFKTTNELNALAELLALYPNIHLYENPSTIKMLDDGPSVLMMPWICEYNFKESMEALKTSQSKFCFGHFQIQGFEMYQGSYCEDGLSSDIFNKFQMVASGHFHKKSSNFNIHYLGATHEMIWSDFNCPRGFHLMDVNTGELEFIKNPYRLFNKVLYSDKNKTIEEVFDVDFEYYKDTFVKVIVAEKTNPYWFDEFLSKFEDVGVIDVKPIEEKKSYLDKTNLTVNGTTDTLSILLNELNDDGSYDRPRLEQLFKDLYIEAQSIET